MTVATRAQLDLTVMSVTRVTAATRKRGLNASAYKIQAQSSRIQFFTHGTTYWLELYLSRLFDTIVDGIFQKWRFHVRLTTLIQFEAKSIDGNRKISSIKQSVCLVMNKEKISLFTKVLRSRFLSSSVFQYVRSASAYRIRLLTTLKPLSSHVYHISFMLEPLFSYSTIIKTISAGFLFLVHISEQ